LLSALDGAVLERWANCSGLYREALSRINKAGVSWMMINQAAQRHPAARSRISLPAESTTESDPWSEIAD
jgi:hypothetical protein